MRSLPQEQRAQFHEFWRDIRMGFDQLDETIEQLTGRPPTASRPSTSHIVNSLRDEYAELIEDQSLRDVSASETVEKIWDLDPVFVMDKLQERRKSVIPVKMAELECWWTGNKPCHNTGYVKMNLRNTINPDTNQVIDAEPFIHQLSIIAKGEGVRLLGTSDGAYNVRSPSCLV